MPRNLVRIRTGEVIVPNWVPPTAPTGYRIEYEPDPFPPPPTGPTVSIATDTATGTSGTTDSTVRFDRAFDWAGEYAQIRIDPVLTRRSSYIDREEMPIRRSYEHFELPLGRVRGKPGFQESKSQSYIGLELENEALKEVQWPACRGWDFHNEGSLRGHGFEYVQHGPAPIPDTFKLLENLLKVINTSIGKVTNSIRTSTHVHFDCTQYTFLDVINFSCLYWMLEGFLSHYCGESRKGNLFCLRLKDAAAGQILLENAIKSGAPYGVPLMRNDYRYSSLNFSSLTKFGSLEFRMLRGTNEYGTIANWVNALECIKQYALKFKTPLELRNHFIKDMDARELPRAVLGKDLSQAFEFYLPEGIPIEGEVREGFLSVSGILTAHKTWDFTEEIKAEKETELREIREHEAFELQRQRTRAAQRQAATAAINIAGDAGPDESADQASEAVSVVLREYTDE